MANLSVSAINAAIEITKAAIESSTDFSLRQVNAEQNVNSFLQSVAEKIQELADRK